MATQLDIELFATYIQSKRGNKGLRATAREIGDISPSTLSRIEQGNMPDLDTFLKVCDWLEMDISQFMISEKNENQGSNEESDAFESLTTPQKIGFHLRADKELSEETAEALANMVEAAYQAILMKKL